MRKKALAVKMRLAEFPLIGLVIITKGLVGTLENMGRMARSLLVDHGSAGRARERVKKRERVRECEVGR